MTRMPGSRTSLNSLGNDESSVGDGLGVRSSAKPVKGRAQKTFRACERCRERHLRCIVRDNQEICNNCKRAKSHCTGRGELVFRFSHLVDIQAGDRQRHVSRKNILLASQQTFSRAQSEEPEANIVLITKPSAAAAHSGRVQSAEYFSDSTISAIDSAIEYPKSPSTTAQPAHTAAAHSSSPSFQQSSLTKFQQRTDKQQLEGTSLASLPTPSVTVNTLSPEFTLSPSHSSVSHVLEAADNRNVRPPDCLGSQDRHGVSRRRASPSEARSVGINEFSDVWPIQNAHEALLLKYFCKNLAPWFDYCDPSNHFGAYVAGLAAEDPILLYAILAVSAKHQSKVTGHDNGTADNYQSRCLDILIPALNDPDQILSDKLLASALILRLFEEMTEPSGEDSITQHTLSVQILLKIKQGDMSRSGLSDAALLVALRQELFIANMTQRPLDPISEHCNIDTSLTPATDAMWTFRAMTRAAEISNFAYSSEQRTLACWEMHRNYIEDWYRLIPLSFRPFSRDQDPEDFFPRIWFVGDLQGAAYQYYMLCKLLLIATDPAVPVLGLRRADALERRDAKMRDCVREVCGVAMSNDEWFPTKSTAGLAIAMCAELFRDPEEQKQLLELLVDAEAHLGWRCLRVGDKLRELWKV